MSTARALISNIRSTHRLLSLDNLLTDRAVLSELKISAQLLVKRETNLRKLWSTDTIFTTIPCLELIEVPISECCDFVDNCTISRTKLQLPRIGEGNYQYAIQGVWSINAMSGKATKLKYITINRYINLLKLPVVKNDTYFWIVNSYLYTNDPMLKALRMSAYFEEDIPNELMFPSDCDCGKGYSLDDLCKNPLDKEFPLPGYLEKQAIQLTSEKLLNTYYRVKQDQTDNRVDGQAVNTTNTD